MPACYRGCGEMGVCHPNQTDRVAELEAFVRDFKECVDQKALQPKVLTASFARLCFDACRLLPSAPEAGVKP